MRSSYPVVCLATRAIFVTLALVSTALAADDRPSGPLSPQAEQRTLRLADPALEIALVAAEPDVVSPVAAAWDEDGRMFVAEMIDYPSGPTAGRIRLLEDRDGDSRFEHVFVFAEGLPFPTSVLPWNGGLLVTAAPNIWFFKDTNGDGRADEKRVVLTGFGEGNQQLRVNGLTWGRDNWVYGANGRSDGAIRRPSDPPEKAVVLGRHDFRFRPATGEFEAVAGFSQFGLPRDDYGDRFPSWNTVPVRHVVLEERILSRNPYLAEASSVASILDPADGGRIFSISPAQATFNREPVVFFNATCGPTIYRGDALDAAYRGNVFVCESLTNLVHRRVLEPAGPTYIARRVEQGKEFLASTDPAFRPVNLTTGPDGALYVIDFYREMVEHPQFVPADIRKSVEFRRWHDRGRIWRITSRNVAPREAGTVRPQLTKATVTQLVAQLGNPNGWWRDTAQRLLVERQDRSAVPDLSKAIRQGPEPLARLHALWTLDGLQALDDPLLQTALRDRSAVVREAAARLANGRPGLLHDVAALAADPAPRVRFEAAVALGGADPGADKETSRALAGIMAQDAGDEWIRLAVLSGIGETAWPFFQVLLDANPRWLVQPTSDQARVLTQVASIVGARQKPDELQGLVARLATDAKDEKSAKDSSDLGRIAVLAGLSEGLARTGQPLQARLATPPPGWESAVPVITALLDRTRRLALTANAPPDQRVQALQLLARARPDSAATIIPELLQPNQPPVLLAAAARAIAEVGSPALAKQVVAQWGTLTTTTRRDVILALLGSTPLTACLLEALEEDAIAITELDATARESLRHVHDPELRKQAEAILARATPTDRGEVLRKYQDALTLKGDPQKGETLFAKTCQTCHQRQGKGNRVGPDLSGVTGRPAAILFNDILDPNHEVSPDFVSFVLVTKQGQILTGLLAEETATSLKLRLPDGAEPAILRSEIEEFRATGRSLMPEGLEQFLSVQDLADVMSYLRRP